MQNGKNTEMQSQNFKKELIRKLHLGSFLALYGVRLNVMLTN